ncbi:hypothetical protein [Tahibacter amnicola]|uniref:Methyl-accepting chemotaxis protein n=1 Tax=Tahibacter amnicola TaxID=2976241 RepID=A0ABY6BFU0_9GAMM|nr:hypothetical protein [Tahibacter amnicola]UXI68634.1 hypothetical protein N4264_02995 [Tahibacter amnicola]
MRALQKAGLVDLEDDTPVAPTEPVAETPSEPVAEPAPPEEPLPPPPVSGTGELVEQRPFDAIYAEQAVPASSFPAEKLLKILDGLGALDPAARIAAVRALDAADDSWTIDDALLDAERKTRALGAARAQLEQHARTALEQARTAIAERDQRQQDAVTHIRTQIAELEALLEREVTRATEEKAAIEGAARGTKEACLREVSRLEGEVARLKRIAEIFGSAGPVSAPQS